MQGDQKIRKKCLIYQKVAKTVSKPKICQNIYNKEQFKVQNSYIKPHSKTLKYYNKSCSETAYLRECVINLLNQKVSQNVIISLGYFILFKNCNKLPKVAQLDKNCPIWSPWFYKTAHLSFSDIIEGSTENLMHQLLLN
jgi:hypothetical protein